jgi:two-component system sensor histidine kinase KdpD
VDRGTCRIYLSATTGAGCTYAMLDEARRRRRRGTEVVIGWVDDHGRPGTAALLDELLEGAPAPTRIDVAALIARRPAVVVVDELAARPAPDAPAHWEAVEELLGAGIDVIATTTIETVESLADAVLAIVGRLPDGSVPDRLLDASTQVELVDITPEAIRRRIAHGNVFPSGSITSQDADLFNSDAFARLRALTFAWMADRLAPSAPSGPERRERIVVALTDAPSSAVVLRRAARLAQRSRGDLVGVHVRTGVDDPAATERRRIRTEALGGRYVELTGTDVVGALGSFTAAEAATQLVVGSPALRRLRRPGRPGVLHRLLDDVDEVDLHVVSEGADRTGTQRTAPGRRSPGRVVRFALSAAVLVAVTAVLVATRDELSVAAALTVYVLTVVAVSALAGPGPGVTVAIVSPLVANWFLVPPYDTFRIERGDHAWGLAFLVTASTVVSVVVARVARRNAEAAQAWRAASTLAELNRVAGTADPDAIASLLQRSFGFRGVAVIRPGDATAIAAAGDEVPVPVTARDRTFPLGDGTVLVTRGAALRAEDHRVVRAFTAQLAAAMEQQRLHRVAREADALAHADELRTAILRAVSHDLRSPLAAIKASVSSLRQPDVDWPPAARAAFLADIEDETDRLTRIVTNLLDLSRLEAGVLRPRRRPSSTEDLLAGVLHGLGDRAGRVETQLTPGLPDLDTDPALVERILANLVENALRWAPMSTPVLVRAHAHRDEVQIHVIDHGPGIPPGERTAAVRPFHRLTDDGPGRGLGLGLAIADRLTTAVGGHLELRDTPGGGLTVVVALPIEDGGRR